MGKTQKKSPKKGTQTLNPKQLKKKQQQKSPFSRLKINHGKYTNEFKAKAKSRLQQWKEVSAAASGGRR